MVTRYESIKGRLAENNFLFFCSNCQTDNTDNLILNGLAEYVKHGHCVISCRQCGDKLEVIAPDRGEDK